MIRYVALLRGINVGGNKKVVMVELRQMLENLGFTDVKTLLNSGNVVFTAKETNAKVLTQKIEENFVTQFGFESKIILRDMIEIAAIIKRDPFKDIQVTPDLRFYVAFLSEPSKSTLKLPYESAKKDFKILQRTDREVFSILTVEAARTGDTMNFIEKEFGKDVTTRNWNTVKKIAAL